MALSVQSFSSLSSAFSLSSISIPPFSDNLEELGLIRKDAILNIIASKPTKLELVLTGRGAPPEIVEAADLVTEMREVKHPFGKGVKARKGIEY